METLKNTLFDYMEEIVRKYRRHGQFRTAEIYQSTLNSFRRFRRYFYYLPLCLVRFTRFFILFLTLSY